MARGTTIPESDVKQQTGTAEAGVAADLKDRLGAILSGTECLAFLDYWLSLDKREGRAVKEAFDPLDIPTLTKNLFIFDVSDRHDALCRFAGTAICDRIGMDLTGRSYRDYVEPERADGAIEALSCIAHVPCVMYAWLQHSKQSYPTKTSDVVGVPFVSADDGRLFTFTFTEVIDRDDPRVGDRFRGETKPLRRQYFSIGFGTPG